MTKPISDETATEAARIIAVIADQAASLFTSVRALQDLLPPATPARRVAQLDERHRGTEIAASFEREGYDVEFLPTPASIDDGEQLTAASTVGQANQV